MGRSTDDDALDQAMIELDSDGNGLVDYDEFTQWFWKEAPEEDRQNILVVYYESARGDVLETTMSELPNLLANGTIRRSTKVWVDGMENWMELSEASSVQTNNSLSGTNTGLEMLATPALLRSIWRSALEGAYIAVL